MESKLEKIFDNLSNHLSVIRNKNTQELVDYIKLNVDIKKELIPDILSRVISLCSLEKWEGRQQGFLTSKAILDQIPSVFDEIHRKKLMEIIEIKLNDPESRVRSAIAETLEALAKVDGINIYLNFKDLILSNINKYFEREIVEKPGEPEFPQELPKLAAKDIKHDTEGWKALETSFQVLLKIMNGVGIAFAPYITPEILDLIFRSGSHTNRFVRETGYFSCGTLCSVCDYETIKNISDKLTKILAQGLKDNWSQVRFAASVATRQFLLQSKDITEKYYDRLLPGMCLNRYYIAPGVNKYSQETWMLVTQKKGKELVAKYIAPIVEFFVEQSNAENHAVREGACHCIAELCTKIDKKAVSPHVETLLSALIECFKDPSWPVRDSACNACGDFILNFPLESKSSMDELFGLFFAHLAENIPSVRSNSAIALGKCMKAYDDLAVEKIVDYVRKELPKVKEQPVESKKYSSLSNETTFGVAHKKLRDNDVELHTGQHAYTCGSMRGGAQDEQKLVHGQAALVRTAGCMDHGFKRDKECWESSDGCIFMLVELAEYKKELVTEFLPTVAEIAQISHFGHHWNLKETIWKQVPKIATKLGRNLFKPFLECLLPPLFLSLTCENRLAQNAAGECLGIFVKLIGYNIVKGRLTQEQLDICINSEFVEPPLGKNTIKTGFIYEKPIEYGPLSTLPHENL